VGPGARTSLQIPLEASSRRGGDDDGAAPPRNLSPTELESFLSTASEQELIEICKTNGWEAQND
jgi:hypothetical protein